MTSRALLYISLLGLCVLVAMAMVADAEDAADVSRDLIDHRIEGGSLLVKRSVGMVTGEEAQGETDGPEAGRRKGRRRGNRRRKGKGKGKGQGKGKRKKGPPQYEACQHPMGMTCTCDMRFEKFKDDPAKQSKFYTIC